MYKKRKGKFNLFNSVKVTPTQRNYFDLSHDVKTTLDMGQLVPVFKQEVVPGDTFTIGCKSLLRFAPLVSPVMHRMDVRVEYYYVPNRILWPNWEDYITGENPSLVRPYFNLTTAVYDANPLCDYLFLPRPETGTTTQITAFAWAAYQRIYNEFYRDQNLIKTNIHEELTDGNNSSDPDLLTLRNRAWEHDYFTSALPTAQSGTAVDIPLGGIGDRLVKVNRDELAPTVDSVSWTVTPNDGSPTFDQQVPLGEGEIVGSGGNYMYAEGATVEPTTINELRTAWSLQRFKEMLIRAGTRYTEVLRSMFSVVSSDARLQRPEYIVGVKAPVIISEVLNNTGEVGTEENPGLPQGNMAGHGMTVLNGTYGTYNVEEWGYIIGVMSVIPTTAYQQGVPRDYLYDDRLDYYWQQFDHLGEQEIQNRELFIDHPEPTGTFGYTARYSHLKYSPSRVTGSFKDSLSYWTLTRRFAPAPALPPALNAEFVTCSPGKDIFAVTEAGVNSIYCQILHKVSALRPMSRYSTPD